MCDKLKFKFKLRTPISTSRCKMRLGIFQQQLGAFRIHHQSSKYDMNFSNNPSLLMKATLTLAHYSQFTRSPQGLKFLRILLLGEVIGRNHHELYFERESFRMGGSG